AFVTGSHAYASDVKRPGMLHGKVLRPTAFKAKLVSVRTDAAAALSGVSVVRDGDFIGTVAPTEFAAAKGVAAIDAEWEAKPQPSSEELFAYLKTHKGTGRGGGGGRGAGRDSQGSAAKAVEGVDHNLQATYTVAYIAHCPLEPRAAVAEWTDD